MPKYIISNRTTDNIELIIPAPRNSGRNGACFVLVGSGSIDILPWAGSIASCKAIAQLNDLKKRNLIGIEVVDV